MPADELEGGDAGELDADDEEEPDTDGVLLGLVLMAVGGLVVGAVTVVTLWNLYPPTRGHKLPIAAVALGSAALIVVLWGVLGRALGRRAADWLVVGYGIAWIVFSLAVAGTSATHFLRRHAVQSHGLPTR